MSALVALKLLVAIAALLWVGFAGLVSARDWHHRGWYYAPNVLARVPQLFLASCVSGTVALLL